MKILISGAGVGGLALAGFLKDSPEFECVFVDKAKELGHTGYALGLWSNGRHMLQKLGLGDKVDAAAVPFKKLTVRDGKGAVLRTFDLYRMDAEFGLSIVHVPRADLHDWLFEAAGKPSVRTGHTIKSITEGKDGAQVVFDDGSEERFDLVVGADGLHSSVRKLLFDSSERYVQWRAWWMWVDGSVCEPHTISEYVEPGCFVLLSHERDRSLAVLMARADHSVWDNEEGRLERLRETFVRESGIVPKLLEGRVAADAMPSDLITVRAPRWHRDRAVIIGDAAHAMTPFSALGGSMALEDAYVLAAELMRAPQNLPRALATYESRRRPRVHAAERLTRRMQTAMAIESPALRALANFFMPFVPQEAVLHSFRSLMREQL